MANQWLRLWHDMPTDPKWRTIARHAKQPISLVQAVYLHLLVDASRNVTRGHVTVTVEDLASALDCDDAAIQAVLDAMQGRVIDGGHLSGWDSRQPKREEPVDGESPAKSPAQRKREQREREREAAANAGSQQSHDASRNVTLDKDKEEDKKEGKSAGAPATPLDSEKPKSRTVTLATYLDTCKALGAKAIPEDHHIRRYCADAGISEEMTAIAWLRFREEHIRGARKAKRYIDWPETFANCVKGSWYGLWTCSSEGPANWTSKGLQEKRVADARRAEKEIPNEPA